MRLALCTFILPILSSSFVFVHAAFPTSLLYQSPTGLFLENIAVRASSQLLLTSGVSPTLHSLDPRARTTPNLNLTLQEVYTFPNATALTGIAEYAPDVFAVVACILDGRTEERGSVVVWRVDFTHPTLPTPQLANSTDANGLSAVPVPGLPDVVLVADSAAGAVYAVNMRTGDVSLAIQAPLLGGSATESLGINGLHVHDGFLYATNSGRGTFVRAPIAILHDHLHNSSVTITRNAAFEVIGVLPPDAPANSAFDDFAFDERGRAWVTVHPGALSLFTPQKNGSWVQENAAGDPEGSYAVFVEPTSAAFGRGGLGMEKTLYVVTEGGQICWSGLRCVFRRRREDVSGPSCASFVVHRFLAV
ncbi:hypothetical protein C8F01DRAFT_1176411 [Mycena amicta]|nr:hypothetical protein C8F01DRAFT_1176411 [Mycena amicta]